MSNPRKPRNCRELEGRRVYVPCGAEQGELSVQRIPLDELEAMRLCDLDGLTQEEAGARMGVSRGTVQRLVTRGRRRLLSALCGSRALVLGSDEDPAVVAGALAGTAVGVEGLDPQVGGEAEARS